MLKKYMDSTLVHLAFAFIAMGSWAFFANRAHPLSAALMAGVVQGTLSATITFFMKKALEGLSGFFTQKNMRSLSLVAPPLITCSVSLMILVGSHILAKTPELIPTIALPFTVAFSYACLYSFRLWTKSQ